jgi:beta-1,4-mannooligosaccharide/beta-1,4-mannosyl-N-acetylglucosamine phosphorylase
MSERGSHDVVKRYEGNPILTISDIPFPCNTVFNAAAAKLNDEYILLLRVEDLRGRSVLALAHSADGYNFTVHDEPVMVPSEKGEFAAYEHKGIEDCRITRLEDTYYIIYTAASDYGARLALAKTEDFRSFERIALISEPDNKDGALFPRKIKGRYARLDRPMAGDTGNIWLSYSDDLVHWGSSCVVMAVRGDCWDSWRVGASAPPIETEFGWLEIYHGVKMTSGGPIYRLGAATLDFNEPCKVLCRSAIPILSPREYYERIGDVNNVVFSCGAIMEPDGEIKIYYGAADTSICVGTVPFEGLMQFCTIGEDH